MNTRNKTKDIIVSAFALFAIFFGAGNLIFPPYLGNMAGDRWASAMFGFLSTDPILPILGVIATAFVGGRAMDLGKRVHPTFAKIIAAICILLIGPILAVPRTAATTYEMAVLPYIGENMQSFARIATSLVFFAITYYFVLNEGKVIDIIGNFLTPGLLIILAAIIIKSAISPIGPIVTTPMETPFQSGFVEGYQTMDALGAALMSGIVLTSLIGKGYTDRKEQKRMLIWVGLIAGVLLAFVYGGLTFVGATTSSTPADDRVILLLSSVHSLFGGVGGVALGIAVALACLTTAVGLVSTCGNFFHTATNDKISYKLVVTLAVVWSFFMSLLSVSGIINLAIPILLTVYPIVIVLILMTLFDKYIKHDIIYTIPVVVAGIAGFIDAMNTTQGQLTGAYNFLKGLPLGHFGFVWLFPTLIAVIIGILVGVVTKGKRTFAEDDMK